MFKKLLLAIVSTTFCISSVISSSNTINERNNVDDNNNPYAAARQRLRQQQQLQHNAQYEQNHFETLMPSNTRNIQLTKGYDDDDKDVLPYITNGNNHMKYVYRMQQQRPQGPLEKGVVSKAESHMKNDVTKADGKRNSADIEMIREQEDDIDSSARKIKSKLSEVFGDDIDDSLVLHGANLNENAKDYHRTQPMSHSTSLSSSDDNSALSTDKDELDLNLPYGIQNVRKRLVRHKPDHSKSITYQSLCITKRIAIPLETTGYEYRPSHYIEVTCAHLMSTHSYESKKNRICSEAGFSCIQLNRTIHLIRRNKASNADCWESEIRIVPSGCECMWPKHDNGDIATYHETSKRFGGYANWQAIDNYEQGEGHREIEPQQTERSRVNGLPRNENANGFGFEAFEYS